MKKLFVATVIIIAGAIGVPATVDAWGCGPGIVRNHEEGN